jgi:lysozyme family protein
MKENFEKCLEMLLKHEGGFVNHPQDPGGMTNLGVTKRTLEEYLRDSGEGEIEVTEDIMRSLTPEMVAPIYKKNYWDAVKGDDLPAGVDWACFDWCVNSGRKRPSKSLQRAVGAVPDGAIGPATLAKVNEALPKNIVLAIHDDRQAFYERLSTFGTFGKGWTRRNKETLEQAIEMMA